MSQGTFSKIGAGTEADPIRPDFSGILQAGEKISQYKKLSETPTDMTVEYTKITMPNGDIDLLEERLNAIKTDYKTLMEGAEAGTLTNAEAQQAIGKAMRAAKELASYLLKKGVFS